MTEITKFNPSDYVDAIKSKIKSAIVDAIPEAMWNDLIKAEIKKMFEPTIVPGRYGERDTTGPSEFTRTVMDVFKDKLRAHVKDVLESPEWHAQWEGTKAQAGELLGKLLVENAGSIISGWLGSAFSHIISSMPNKF